MLVAGTARMPAKQLGFAPLPHEFGAARAILLLGTILMPEKMPAIIEILSLCL